MVASEEIAASGHMEFEMTRAKPDWLLRSAREVLNSSAQSKIQRFSGMASPSTAGPGF